MRYNHRIKPRLGTRLNREHSLAKGLVGCWVMNEGTGDKVFDLSENNDGIIGSSLIWDINPYGFTLNGSGYSDANGYINVGSNIDPRTWDGITICVSAHFIQPSNGQYPSLVSNLASGEYYDNYNLSYENSVGGDVSLQWRPGQNSSSLGIISPGINNTDSVVTATWIKQGTAKIYINGIEKTSGSRTNGWDASNYTTNINGYYRTDHRTGANKYYYIYIYDRALSAKEIMQLYREPYAMFQKFIIPALVYYSVEIVPTGVFYGPLVGPFGGPI